MIDWSSVLAVCRRCADESRRYRRRRRERHCHSADPLLAGRHLIMHGEEESDRSKISDEKKRTGRESHSFDTGVDFQCDGGDVKG